MSVRQVDDPLEAKIEGDFVRWCCNNGVLTVKLQQARGWPDRQVLLEGGVAVFIEFKRKGGKVGAMQRLIHEQIERRGFHVFVCRSVIEAVNVIRRLQAQAVRDRL